RARALLEPVPVRAQPVPGQLADAVDRGEQAAEDDDTDPEHQQRHPERGHEHHQHEPGDRQRQLREQEPGVVRRARVPTGTGRGGGCHHATMPVRRPGAPAGRAPSSSAPATSAQVATSGPCRAGSRAGSNPETVSASTPSTTSAAPPTSRRPVTPAPRSANRRVAATLRASTAPEPSSHTGTISHQPALPTGCPSTPSATIPVATTTAAGVCHRYTAIVCGTQRSTAAATTGRSTSRVSGPRRACSSPTCPTASASSAAEGGFMFDTVVPGSPIIAAG